MSPRGTEPALSHGARLDPDSAEQHHPSGPRFELRAELGLGGMGQIQLAHDRWLGRDVALKLPATEADARRLEREARITARLEHPAIVPIYDSGTFDDGRPWFAMRLVRGKTLADHLAAPVVSRAALLRHVLGACEAIAFAHQRGVVHRDIKANNIMVGAFGETQVIDWGLALAPDMPPADGARAGTPGSMSPEQERGEAADARSDVWALGKMIALVAGPSPQHELAAVIARATMPSRDDRYPDAAALARDLAAWLDGRRVEAHAYGRVEVLLRFARAWRWPLGVAAVALVALAIVLVVMFTRLRAERDQAEANLAVSLTSEARRALRQDARAEAEILSAHALARAPIAEARGILAAAVSGGRPSRSTLDVLAECSAVDLAGARVLCRSHDRLSVREHGRALWTQFRENEGALFLAAGTAIAVVVDHDLLRLDALTGAALGPAEPLPCFMRLVSADGRSVFSWNGGCAAEIFVDRVVPLPRETCAPSSIGTLAADPHGARWAATCGDGTIALSDAGAVLAAGLGVAPRGPLPSALAFAPGARLLVGDAVGGLLRLSLDDPGRHERLHVHDGLVRHIVVSADGTRAAVLGERAPPMVVDLVRFQTLGRLPDGVVAAWDGHHLIAAGRRLERWDFDAVLPRALELGLGIGALAISPSGARLAIGHDSGVTLFDLPTRRALTAHRWQDNTVKTLAFASDDALIAHGLGATAIMRFLPGASSGEDLNAGSGGRWRRIVALADGTLLLATYGSHLERRHPDGRRDVALEREVVDLATSPDLRAVVALGADHALFCGPDLLRCGADRAARAVALADGERIFTARAGAIAAFAAGAEVARFAAPGADLLDLAAARTADGTRVIAGSARDGSLWLFRETSSVPWAILRDHGARADRIAIDPTGTLVIAGGWDGHVVFWPVPERADDHRPSSQSHWGIDLQDVFAPTAPR